MKIEEQVVDIINENLNIQLVWPANRNDILLNIGMDSVNFIMSIVELEEEFGICFPESFLVRSDTVTLNDFCLVVCEELSKK